MRRNALLLAVLTGAAWLSFAGTTRAQSWGGAYHNPYTGAGYAAGGVYNPYTGGFYEGRAAYNPYLGVAVYGQRFYNPYLNAYGGVVGYYNPYLNTYGYQYRVAPAYPWGWGR
jgi:hypothetical protein